MKMTAELQKKFDQATTAFAEDPARGLKMLKAEADYQFIEAVREFLPEQFKRNKVLQERINQLEATENKTADEYYLVAEAYGSRGARYLKEAVANYRKAAEMGHGGALDYMGHAYQYGKVGQQGFDSVTLVEVSRDQAVNAYMKAAGQGHAGAQYHLGLLIESKNPMEAVELLTKSADQRDAAAQFKLGRIHADDTKTGSAALLTKDLTQALFWFRKAADQGYPSAREEAEKIDFSHALALIESNILPRLDEDERLGKYSSQVKTALKDVLDPTLRAQPFPEVRTSENYDQRLFEAVRGAILEGSPLKKAIKICVKSCIEEQAVSNADKKFNRELNAEVSRMMRRSLSVFPDDMNDPETVPLLAKYNIQSKRAALREPDIAESAAAFSHAQAVLEYRAHQAQQSASSSVRL